MKPHYVSATIRSVSAAIHTPQLGAHAVTGGLEILSRRQWGDFVGLAPKQSFSTSKLKYETLEISEVFINQYYILSCDLYTDQYQQLWPRMTSPDYFWYVFEVINLWGLSVWLWFIHAFLWLKSRSNTNAARAKAITSDITN